MSLLDRSLDLFDRHKYGIIGTLAVHTALIGVFILGKFSTPPVEREAPPMEMVLEDETPETETSQSAGDEASAATAQVTNLASNVTASIQPLSRAAQERMAQRVEQDLHDLEKSEFDRLAEERRAEGKEITVPELDPSKFDKSNYMEKMPKPVKVEGLTTVSYDLVGRAHIVLEVPAYLCKGSGKIVIRVAVDRAGTVTKAELDPAQSTDISGCMAENALISAKGARFTASNTAAQPQKGTITYIFLAQ